MSGRRLGLFGGTFDPIHRGHVEPAREARHLLGLERVLFLPTADPPHKAAEPRTPAHNRFAMVELALLEEEGLYASAYELTPGQTAYTVETLEHFQRQEPGVELYLLLGSDSLLELHTWRRWREILELARLVILARPGWEVEPLEEKAAAELIEALSSQPTPAVVRRPVDVAATVIRRALSQGLDPAPGWVHPQVLHYIRKNALYR